MLRLIAFLYFMHRKFLNGFKTANLKMARYWIQLILKIYLIKFFRFSELLLMSISSSDQLILYLADITF